ncbi:hypothetical protein O3G_MSEX004779 [Manduca sexta]|uniref:RING finger protein unkempt n=1 Tax=Manduca sexta TaxID=7130 RepID=A0A921YWE6_MANSE|nr:hypothetical protein O3G_MSEX004779 [Manduca sexta]
MFITDTNYVLSSYKTEPCKRPPRLCRQGYACPQYHNSKDKRRSPRKYKYRSTPCPNVKHGEEWGEPSNCEAGDACGYCHTRTEQQFHPEIYKSTKCNDVQQAGYCPRGLFCAFAHVEPEEPSMRDPVPQECGTSLAELLSSALPADKKQERAASPLVTLTNGAGDGSECASTSSGGSGGKLGVARLTRAAPFDATVLQEVVGCALDDIHLDDPLNLVAALDRDLSDGEGPLGGSAPVNIPQPRATLRGFSPPGGGGGGGSPLPAFLRYNSDAFGALKAGSFGAFEGGAAEVSRLREEVAAARAAVARWDERVAQARAACEAWKREAEEASRKASLAERQRDEALAHALALRRELDALTTARRDPRGLPLPALKALQARARTDLEEIEKALYLETATKCMVCEEQPRAVTLAPCNHYVLCDACAATTDECPYCQTPVQRHQ